MQEFPEIGEMDVLDLGGLESSWDVSPARPKRLMLVNVTAQETRWAQAVVADACSPPHLGRFDLVFSNSVIDQVGGHWRRQRFAETVQAAADCYWIQTSYRYFPLDSYRLFPMFFALPVRAQVAVIRRWPLADHGATTRAEAFDVVRRVELLTKTDLAGYFPGSRILTETFAGLPKSIIATR